ncbi:MAG: rod shape-determining protein MreC [Armatimonadetes bacterium]|nr:rod shape-determining protein MreC [Armatimonadota bacterium]
MILAGLCVLAFVLGQVQDRARDDQRSDVLTRAIKTVVKPGASASVWAITSTGGLWNDVRDVRSSKEELERLRAMETEYQRYQESVDMLGSRLSRLQDMHDLPTYGDHTKVYAKVIGSFLLQNRITLNRGSRHGLAGHMPVVSADGLVGWIDTVDKNSSQVLLLSSPAIDVAAKVLLDPTKNVPGILRGETAARLVMQTHDSNEVRVGDMVVTSGFSETIPEGIPIGMVFRIDENQQLGTRRVLVLPHVRMGSFNEVYVLK